MKIQTLRNSSLHSICKAFAEAFADYEVQLTDEQLIQMLQRKGFDPALSFAAFEADKIIAFTLNGIGEFNGVRTAYDIGTGTLKEFRGQGLASKIFQYSIPHLNKNHIAQYLLEVLQHNTHAVKVYLKLGFKVTREFHYFKQQVSTVKNKIAGYGSTCSIHPISIHELEKLAHFQDFCASWQNSFEAVARNPEKFIILGAHNTHDKLTGYCILEPDTGDIAQIAVEQLHRRKGIASLLLHDALKRNACDIIKVINTDVKCHTLTCFLESKNINPKGRQFEMIKSL